MPRSVNNLNAASDGQYFPSGQSLVDGNRVQSLVGMVELFAITRPNSRGAGLNDAGREEYADPVENRCDRRSIRCEFRVNAARP